MKLDLEGKVAIVTGSSRGLGQQMARALAGAGASLVITSRNPESLTGFEKEIKEMGSQVLPVKLDVTVQKDIENMVQKTVDTFGRIDILVNNAGCIVRKPALELREQDWDRVTDTILKGSFFCAQSVARVMKEQGQGRIINIGSATCALGTEGIIPYGAAKGGLLQLTKGLAVEWGKYGITVNIVAPGWFKTKQNEEMYENRAWVEKVKERIPLDRIGGEHDLDGITVFLASDYSEYITGQILYVDGGYTVSAVKAIDKD